MDSNGSKVIIANPHQAHAYYKAFNTLVRFVHHNLSRNCASVCHLIHYTILARLRASYENDIQKKYYPLHHVSFMSLIWNSTMLAMIEMNLMFFSLVDVLSFQNING